MSTTNDPRSLTVKFRPTDDMSRKTRWRWLKGDGELVIAGEMLTLRGRRWRPLLPGTAQSVNLQRNQIRDVQLQGDVVEFAVNVEGGADEPVRLQFESEAIAREISAGWPAERSRNLVDRQAFADALQRTGVRAWVTPVLAGICVVVFIVMAVAGVPVFEPRGPELLPWGTDYGPLTLRGEPWRLFTSMFLHFGAIHLGLNMWALLSLGPLTEKLLGNVRFLVLYLVAGLCGSMVSMLWHPVTNSAGASGAIFGVMGALLAVMVNPRSHVPAAVARQHRNSAAIFLAYNVLNSFRSGIDMAAHLGGLVAGFVLGWLFAKPLPEADQPPPRVSPVPGMVAAAIMMLALAWPLFQPGTGMATRREFRFMMIDFAGVEDAAIAGTDELQRQVDSKRITERQWAKSLKSDVVPLWTKVVDAARKFPAGKTREQMDLAAILPIYAQGQVDMYELAADSVLLGDHGKELRAADIRRKQDERVKIAQDLIKKL